MSERVTIGDIAEDLLPFTEKGNKVITVEIVPRKIIEDIIAYCNKQREKRADQAPTTVGIVFAYDDVKAFAETQLRKFEDN